MLQNIVEYVQNDLRKLDSIYNLYKNHEKILHGKIIHKIFEKKNFNEDTKDITKKLLLNYYSIEQIM